MLPSFGNPGNPTDPLDLSDDGITALEAPPAGQIENILVITMVSVRCPTTHQDQDN